jgi:hypothetical protein
VHCHHPLPPFHPLRSPSAPSRPFCPLQQQQLVRIRDVSDDVCMLRSTFFFPFPAFSNHSFSVCLLFKPCSPAPPVCHAVSGCTSGSCLPPAPLADGTSCDDSSALTSDDLCFAGNCHGAGLIETHSYLGVLKSQCSSAPAARPLKDSQAQLSRGIFPLPRTILALPSRSFIRTPLARRSAWARLL